MPAKNIIKTYVENGYYHLYNRGVEKRRIFLNKHNYQTFLFYLKLYLSPPKSLLEPDKIHPLTKKRVRLDIKQVSLYGKIKLLAYCLMPNHFHLLVKQKTDSAITELIRKVCTAYSLVFNQRYNRVGALFQGRYKAVLIDTDEQLMHISRYIHQNPKEVAEDGPMQVLNYPYSSLSQYLGKYKTAWLHPEEILTYFSQKSPVLDYKNFVLEKETEEESLLLANLKLEVT